MPRDRTPIFTIVDEDLDWDVDLWRPRDAPAPTSDASPSETATQQPLHDPPPTDTVEQAAATRASRVGRSWRTRLLAVTATAVALASVVLAFCAGGPSFKTAHAPTPRNTRAARMVKTAGATAAPRMAERRSATKPDRRGAHARPDRPERRRRKQPAAQPPATAAPPARTLPERPRAPARSAPTPKRTDAASSEFGFES